jgi:hypothetical protein
MPKFAFEEGQFSIRLHFVVRTANVMELQTLEDLKETGFFINMLTVNVTPSAATGGATLSPTTQSANSSRNFLANDLEIAFPAAS